MAYEMYWHIEKRVIGSRYFGDVLETELLNHGIEVEQYIKEGVQPMYLIVDARNIEKYPTNLKDLIEVMGKNPSNSNNLAYTFVITNSKLINFIGAMVSNFFKTPIRACKTMEEAETFITHQAPDLAPALEARKVSSSSQPT
jgi:hypothetical protein